MSTPRMPVLFVGHGSPMNAIEDNRWSQGFTKLGQLVPLPKAIVAVSAHWYVNGTYTTGNEKPETIHDFGGFPPELYEVQYPAKGDPALAARVASLMGPRAEVSQEWGLDHGTWSVVKFLRPKADVPVIQLSIDARLPIADHLALGRALKPLRDEGVLVIGSGNITHNLRHAFMSLRSGKIEQVPWATDFDADISKALTQHDAAFLAQAPTTENGRMSHPTLDHYLPLLYAAGAGEGDAVTFPITGFDLASLSMRSVMFGA